jgi:hypothetical protein
MKLFGWCLQENADFRTYDVFDKALPWHQRYLTPCDYATRPRLDHLAYCMVPSVSINCPVISMLWSNHS